MNKPDGYYEKIPFMVPGNVQIVEAEIYASPLSETGFRAYPLDKRGKPEIHGKDLMMDDAIYLRQDNSHDFKRKPLKAEMFRCEVTFRGEIEYRYKIHKILY